MSPEEFFCKRRSPFWFYTSAIICGAFLWGLVSIWVYWPRTHPEPSWPPSPKINLATRTEQQLYKDIENNQAYDKSYLVNGYIYINKNHALIINSSITIACHQYGSYWLHIPDGVVGFSISDSYISLTEECSLQ